jgi:hypothetical protein
LNPEKDLYNISETNLKADLPVVGLGYGFSSDKQNLAPNKCFKAVANDPDDPINVV